MGKIERREGKERGKGQREGEWRKERKGRGKAARDGEKEEGKTEGRKERERKGEEMAKVIYNYNTKQNKV